MNKDKEVVLKKKAKDYIVVTLISHGIGLAVFTPYNLAVLNFTFDQLIRNAIASTGIAFVIRHVFFLPTYLLSVECAVVESITNSLTVFHLSFLQAALCPLHNSR